KEAKDLVLCELAEFVGVEAQHVARLFGRDQTMREPDHPFACGAPSVDLQGEPSAATHTQALDKAAEGAVQIEAGVRECRCDQDSLNLVGMQTGVVDRFPTNVERSPQRGPLGEAAICDLTNANYRDCVHQPAPPECELMLPCIRRPHDGSQ